MLFLCIILLCVLIRFWYLKSFFSSFRPTLAYMTKQKYFRQNLIKTHNMYHMCTLIDIKRYCYFQDDDWENRHLRSLYANFLRYHSSLIKRRRVGAWLNMWWVLRAARYPHLLHTDTNAFVHYLSWAWTFFEPSMLVMRYIHIQL